MTRIYLAARYSRREELLRYRADLEARGHTVTSRWLNGNHQIDDAGLSAEGSAAERQRFAEEDWDDLQDAEVCISFTEAPRAANSRGGRHVEFGAALAGGHTCIIVGPRENVFHCLPQVYQFDTWEELLAFPERQPGELWELEPTAAALITARRSRIEIVSPPDDMCPWGHSGITPDPDNLFMARCNVCGNVFRRR